jgi:hypothetical protein
VLQCTTSSSEEVSTPSVSSSLNCGFSENPSAVSNALARATSLTGRLTNLLRRCVGTCVPSAASVDMLARSPGARRDARGPIPDEVWSALSERVLLSFT